MLKEWLTHLRYSISPKPDGMALGANGSSVVAIIMRGAMLQTGIGLAVIGIPVAWFCVR